ncbi:hypothetical protein GUITHDRAFT_152909 [Guillardia theta CCMP2712]|uniref:Carbonic anhydrase n=3 Tax=Eukaryota TaxID=2759 RepID=L1J8B4_GUITC|nr:hypothetical protein GUITHDRAFT_152909 [Guillardia theta CCMP2712]EKX44592.1 hypothetical protein GUITHDRAFT_152909 [Guillardia theta CCMP2712]|mmetsp:Transcript_36285/g.113232  ORF Transcript_36285/g.113232 Transcript_36285/m.113232 type:complete len:290 (+) Transcript_36285:101-970(+)|eukprot:XP_005831572.1 hypothetical protein GUITHDRAFT_152909 [Guillardia theta CCMP2712]
MHKIILAGALALSCSFDAVSAFVAPGASMGKAMVAPRLRSSTSSVAGGLRMQSKADIVAPLFEANKKWIQAKKAKDPKFFDRLGSVHKPEVFWIGSADSRVAANEIIGAEPGEVFVCRNMANIVLPFDVNLMSALQYAVDYLEVQHIIVCGHYSCEGINIALNKENYASPLENWISHVRNVYRAHADVLDAIPDEEQRKRKLVELNVMESCMNVYQLAIVQNRLKMTKPTQPYSTPRIHACVYETGTGELKKINWFPEGMEDPFGMRYDESSNAEVAQNRKVLEEAIKK